MDDTSYMVRCSTRAACQAALDRLCAALDAEPTMTPKRLTDDRWMARAVPARTTKAPTGDHPGRGPDAP